ncbi:MAG: 30S ribosomal protein S16 [Alphaproteobacteria bacterium]|jgi:small subunit ribosomal protein S16|nr:30S ribosomal protein S16 [Alphaproteobacteria bacterium]
MAVKLRLARWGAKKNPYYHIVAADSRAPRDGKYIETVGKYNPMVDGDKKYILENDRIKYWLGNGAVPTDRVHKIFAKFGILEAKSYDAQNKKSTPKAKAQERLKAVAEAKAAAESKPAEETPAAE